ncbi:circadian clock KaiB family protein [Bradyrhizobium sp. HKCCYLR20261]|jgi:circadian clock protein KaiB|uniref:circadian clock KaiB family protein n=1 Tax=unclassified Bradyrhizobium TaxID=2631580 RepID=UPI003EBBA235
MTLQLGLFVTGQTSNSLRAMENLRRIVQQELNIPCEIDIIDVLEHPQIAEDEKIVATPTLVKRHPGPVRKIIGDLSDTRKVLLGLGILQNSSTVQLGKEEGTRNERG